MKPVRKTKLKIVKALRKIDKRKLPGILGYSWGRGVTYSATNDNPRARGRARSHVVSYSGISTRASDRKQFLTFLKTHGLKLGRKREIVHENGRQLNSHEFDSVLKLVNSWEGYYFTPRKKIANA